MILRQICVPRQSDFDRIEILATLLTLVVLLWSVKISALVTTTNQANLYEDHQEKPHEIKEVHSRDEPTPRQSGGLEKRAFVMELLRMLHEQYGNETHALKPQDLLEERRSATPGQIGAGPRMMQQLLEAIGADGDMRRLIDWIRSSFSPAALPEVATQFVVSKLGSVNCPALLQPDREDLLIPRFLLFNEHFVDVPFELSINPNQNECLANGKLDPARKTLVLVHGYLTGYTLVDGITNIKNRLLDLNRAVLERTMSSLAKTSEKHQEDGSSFVYTEDLDAKISRQMYNVIVVDWFNGANPTPRANYIRSAVNAQVVGRLIARFLSALIVQCKSPASNIEIIAHSLGCHVSGFTGKAMNAAGHRLGKITHLDPVGLCFGRLFSQPRFRLSPDDALETQAVHTSLNIFDNPLDGTHSNFLVNGGRDQAGCGGPSEITNSTTSSVSLLFDPAAKFGACSHMRALDLFEEDQSSERSQCQLVGYRCQNYDRFLAGKCGQCDSANSQCRLMSLAPISTRFRQMSLAPERARFNADFYDLLASSSKFNRTLATTNSSNEAVNKLLLTPKTIPRQRNQSAGLVTSRPPGNKQQQQSPIMFGAPSYMMSAAVDGNELGDDFRRRSDRRLTLDKRDRFAQALDRLRTETRTALVGGWSSLRTVPLPELASDDQMRNSAGDLEHGCESEQQSSFVASIAPATATSSTAPPPSTTIEQTTETTIGQMRAAPLQPAEPIDAEPLSRTAHEPADNVPVGGQKPPAGSLQAPLYFVGTSAVASYCLNYYQFRVLIAESRLMRVIKANGLGSNRLAPQLSQHRGGIITAAATLQQRVANANGRDMLHLTVKLSDSLGRFFKGFSMLEHAHSLGRVINDFAAPSPLPSSVIGGGPAVGVNEPMVELTMLLNSTRPQPRRIGEAIISYYFHQIVLADRLEINYMSNISPEIRAEFSSVLCPVAINDRHQLVKYVECRKVSAAAAR